MDYIDILNEYKSYKGTCSLQDMRGGCITFARSKKYINCLNTKKQKDVVILVPAEFENSDLPSGWKFIFVDNVDYVFIMLHNTLYKDVAPQQNVIGNNCFIHPTAVLNVEGMHVTKSPDGKRVQMKHVGNVVIEDDVMVLAGATLQRAVFGSTTIKRGVQIDSHVNIGHNSYIGEDSVLALGAIVGGSVNLGKNCMVGLGAILRNGISICDDVIIGQGANVVSDVTKSGLYMGFPAKFFKEYNKDWNF